MILDQHGNPIDLAAIREPQTEAPELSRTAWLHREFDDHPGRGLTPARLNAILREAEEGDLIRQLELADDMEERDAQIYSELAKRKSALATLEWDVEPPEGASSAEQKAADQVREWLRAIPAFDEVILIELMDAVLKGFKCIEMWWELDAGTLQPRFEPQPQRWFTLDERRRTLTLRDATSQYGVALRPWGWLTHVHKSRNGYLARGSLARVLAWPYLFKNYATRDLAEFLEIYGLPLRLGKYPTGASDAEKRTLLQAVVGIGHNAAGIIPQAMALEFQNAAQGNEKPFQTMMDAMDAAESKAILGQTLTSGEGQHGTQALGQVHNEVRLDILKSDARRIAGTLTAQLVAPLVILNIPGADPKRLPRFTIDVPEPEDLALYADALPKLAAAGMKIGVKDMHRRLRIPEAEDGEDLLRGPSAAPANAAGAPDAPPDAPGAAKAAKDANAAKDKKAALAGDLPAPGAHDALDELVDEELADWRPLLGPLVQPLLDELDKAVAAGESLAAFAARLPQLVEQMDGRPLAESVARAAFVARLAGAADLDLTHAAN